MTKIPLHVENGRNLLQKKLVHIPATFFRRARGSQTWHALIAQNGIKKWSIGAFAHPRFWRFSRTPYYGHFSGIRGRKMTKKRRKLGANLGRLFLGLFGVWRAFRRFGGVWAKNGSQGQIPSKTAPKLGAKWGPGGGFLGHFWGQERSFGVGFGARIAGYPRSVPVGRLGDAAAR